MSGESTFWWTRADGTYGSVRADDIQDARRQKPNAKIHRKPPFSWMSGEPAPSRRTSRSRAVTKKRTSRARKPAKAPTAKAPTAPTTKTERKPAGTTKQETSETLSEQDAIAFAHKLLAEWSVAGYSVVFSTGARMHRALGVCDYRKRQIRLSRLIWPRASKEDRRVTVIHEVAHAVVRDRFPTAAAHGADWMSQMRAMGVRSPDAKHSVDVGGLLAQKRADVVAVACCGRSWDITIHKLNRFGGPGAARCKCKGGGSALLTFASAADEKKYREYRRRLAANPSRVHVCGGG